MENFVKFQNAFKIGAKISLSNFWDNHLDFAKDLFKKDLQAHYSCVNAIEFSKDGSLLISGGDCTRVMVWDTTKAYFCDESVPYRPVVCQSSHYSNIFGVGVTSDKSLIISGGNDGRVLLHDLHSGNLATVDTVHYPYAVYHVSTHPSSSKLFLISTEDGLSLLDCRVPHCSSGSVTSNTSMSSVSHSPVYNDTTLRSNDNNSPLWLNIDRVNTERHCSIDMNRDVTTYSAYYHPNRDYLVITTDIQFGALQWDIRKPASPMLHYGPNAAYASSARWDSSGEHLFALYRSEPPCIYETCWTSSSSNNDIMYERNSSAEMKCKGKNMLNSYPMVVCKHEGYSNVCTLKSACFVGSKDQYLMTGSDDFQLYMWKVGDAYDQARIRPDDACILHKAHSVFYGHRCIVNQVRYDPNYRTVVSAGVEKIIKLWSLYALPGSHSDLSGEHSDYIPRVIKHNDEISSVMRVIPQDAVRNESLEEDSEMLQFFDFLVESSSRRGVESNNDDEARQRRLLSRRLRLQSRIVVMQSHMTQEEMVRALLRGDIEDITDHEALNVDNEVQSSETSSSNGDYNTDELPGGLADEFLQHEYDIESNMMDNTNILSPLTRAENINLDSDADDEIKANVNLTATTFSSDEDDIDDRSATLRIKNAQRRKRNRFQHNGESASCSTENSSIERYEYKRVKFDFNHFSSITHDINNDIDRLAYNTTPIADSANNPVVECNTFLSVLHNHSHNTDHNHN